MCLSAVLLPIAVNQDYTSKMATQTVTTDSAVRLNGEAIRGKECAMSTVVLVSDLAAEWSVTNMAL